MKTFRSGVSAKVTPTGKGLKYFDEIPKVTRTREEVADDETL
jgi:hypothetical protein